MKNRVINLFNENKNILGLLCLFMIMQPFLDTYELFTNPKLQIFGFTIPTLVRCLFIFILALIVIRKIPKKHYKYIFIYLTLVAIYTICHHFVVSDTMNVPDNYIYSVVTELFYIIRMLLPLTIIYFTKNSNINYQKFIHTILISSAIIGTIVFIGNTLCISYTSYEIGITKVNWIYWFIGDTSKYKFWELTSKGWFFMANQVSGLAIMLFPICVYDLLKKCTKLNFYSCLILIISMIMLGTRTASYGWLLVILCYILTLSFLKFIVKQNWWTFKRVLPLCIITFIGLIFLIVSPIKNREYGYKLGDLDSLGARPNEEDTSEIIAYIEKSYKVFAVKEDFLFDIYNYKFDPHFWLQVFDLSLEKGVVENREMQSLVSRRIALLNKDLKYRLFGFSFSRMRSAELYMEHDFIVQTFTMGYIGLILLVGPYIVLILLVGIKILKKLNKEPKLLEFVFLISMCAVLGASVFSGHILDELFVTIYLGFICGFFFRMSISMEVLVNEKDKS